MKFHEAAELMFAVPYDQQANVALQAGNVRQARKIFLGRTPLEQAQIYKAGMEDGFTGMLKNVVNILSAYGSGFGIFDPSGKNSIEAGTVAMADAYKKGASAAVVNMCTWLTSQTDQSMVPRGGAIKTVYEMLQDAGETVSILGDKKTLLPVITQRCREEGLPDLAPKFEALRQEPASKIFAVAVRKIATEGAFLAPVMAFPPSTPSPL